MVATRAAYDVESVLARLAEGNGRRTAARQAIVEAVVSSGSHVTADDIARKVQRRFPSVNISTVYRTLEALEDLGVVDHVHLGHGRAIYHLADEEHQHLFCERCEAVVELPTQRLRPFLRSIQRDLGFEVDRRHFAIIGLCRRCSAER